MYSSTGWNRFGIRSKGERIDTIKVGIIGTGGISRAHQRTYQKTGGFEIVAVCDIFKEKAEKAAEEWGVPKKYPFKSFEKMLDMDEIDTISVCTYNQAHRKPTVAALDAGRHVFCEKPMAATLGDVTAMAQAAKRSGRILQIGIHGGQKPSPKHKPIEIRRDYRSFPCPIWR